MWFWRQWHSLIALGRITAIPVGIATAEAAPGAGHCTKCPAWTTRAGPAQGSAKDPPSPPTTFLLSFPGRKSLRTGHQTEFKLHTEITRAWSHSPTADWASPLTRADLLLTISLQWMIWTVHFAFFFWNLLLSCSSLSQIFFPLFALFFSFYQKNWPHLPKMQFSATSCL